MLFFSFIKIFLKQKKRSQQPRPFLPERWLLTPFGPSVIPIWMPVRYSLLFLQFPHADFVNSQHAVGFLDLDLSAALHDLLDRLEGPQFLRREVLIPAGITAFLQLPHPPLRPGRIASSRGCIKGTAVLTGWRQTGRRAPGTVPPFRGGTPSPAAGTAPWTSPRSFRIPASRPSTEGTGCG